MVQHHFTWALWIMRRFTGFLTGRVEAVLRADGPRLTAILLEA
jgi:hypothetical protein